MIRWGVGFGVADRNPAGRRGAVGGRPLHLRRRRPGRRSPLALWVLAAGQPLAGYVFVLDGVLIGAGDARYLAIAGVVNLAVYLPLLLAVR